MAAVEAEQNDPAALLRALRQAREQYERDVAHRDESNKFWRGLVNRWDQALEFAEKFLADESEAPAWRQADERWAAQEPRLADDSGIADDSWTAGDSWTADASSRIDNTWGQPGTLRLH
jgi:hypothetical protein